MATGSSPGWRRARLAGAACLVWCLAFSGVGPVSGQGGRGSRPLTPWGDPDLQGTWPSGSLIAVPFERQEALGERTTFSEEEGAARAAQLQAGAGAGGIGPPPHWLELGDEPSQTSLVVEPEDGRLPPLTAEGEARAAQWRTQSAPAYLYAGPEDLRPYDRCITRGVLGSAIPNIYSAGMQILQAPGLVVIRHEMIHETRVIPLDGRAHLPAGVRSWMGDPRGRWEGDTLVVETTNFNGRTGSYGRNGDGNPTSEALRLVERFQRTAPDTLRYEVHVEDPLTFTDTWGVAFDLPRDADYTLYEYACHEGNHAMTHMLSAARAAERAAN
jgi:hypothetical protein